MAEAVVSAYINEIAPAEHVRERARIRHSRTDSSPRAIARIGFGAMRSRRQVCAPHSGRDVEQVRRPPLGRLPAAQPAGAVSAGRQVPAAM
jgi:hypothetical protein